MLQEVLDNMIGINRTIVLGDFNAQVSSHVISRIKLKFNEEELNKICEMLVSTCAGKELRINNINHKAQYNTFENEEDRNQLLITLLLIGLSIQHKYWAQEH